jgi:hypothetical protein
VLRHYTVSGLGNIELKPDLPRHDNYHVVVVYGWVAALGDILILKVNNFVINYKLYNMFYNYAVRQSMSCFVTF